MKRNYNHRPRWDFKFLTLFLERGSIHGLPYVGQRRFSLLERVMWLLLAFVSLYYSIYLALESLDRYRTKNTVISIERDYHYWNSTMPSTTICPMNRLSVKKFEDYCRVRNITGTDKDELFEFLESLANSTYSNFNIIKTYPSIDKHNINPKDYMYLIYNLTENYLKNSMLLADTGVLNIFSEQILTEWGICYSTNNYLISDLSTSRLLFGKLPGPIPKNWIRVVRKNVFDNDGNYEFLGLNGALSIYIHSPYEVMTVERAEPPNIMPIDCSIQTFEIMASDDFARSTTVKQRQCRFPYESNLTHFPIYSRNLCQQECRINLAYKLCKCIPHFYPNLGGKKPVCHYNVLKDCIFRHADVFENLNKIKNLSLDMDAINCYCLPNCRSTEIVEQTCTTMTETGGILNGNGIQFRMVKYPHLRMQRQIIFTLTDLLVSVGGTAGFFLGSSVLSAVEVVYYFTVRLFWHCLGYKE